MSCPTKKIVFVIPCFSDVVKTLESIPECLSSCSVFVCSEKGFSFARNNGAVSAVMKHDNCLLVFLDSDLVIKKEFFEHFLSLSANEFAMSMVKGFPIPNCRALVIWANDFFDLNGFDILFNFGSEDHDFFFRAIDAGLRFCFIPSDLIVHVNHEPRNSNIHSLLRIIYANARKLKRHGINHPILFRVDVLERIRKRQFITVFLIFCALLFQICRLEKT